MTGQTKKHPCADCRYCQWCSDDRCRLCLKTGCQAKKLSLAEQIEVYERLNRRQPGKTEQKNGEP